MPAQVIKIIGARQHNLKNLSVEIPREKLVVITGLSGSGKSSLAFDTLYAEGQRRYVESLSAYARQFLDKMEKPDVDFIEGLSPAIAIEQRSAGANPRSAIATTTEIYDYLRVLFSAVGQPHDPVTGKALVRQTPQQIVDQILAYPPETKIVVLAPIVENERGEFRDVIEKLRREGFVRARIDGEIVELEQTERLYRDPQHPYTRALLSVVPEHDRLDQQILTGEAPDPTHIPVGCRFHPRCPVYQNGEAERLGLEGDARAGRGRHPQLPGVARAHHQHPAVVTEFDSTTVVHPGFAVSVDGVTSSAWRSAAYCG